MAWYVGDRKTMKDDSWAGMTVAGPFDTRAEADDWCTENIKELCCPMLMSGPEDLGDDWFTNLSLWYAGELTGSSEI